MTGFADSHKPHPPWWHEDDLHREWDGYLHPNESQLARLDQVGIGWKERLAAGGIAIARVSIAGRLYVPFPAGRPCFMVRVFDGHPPTPDYPVLHRLLDLVGFGIADPNKVCMRIGQGGLILGRGAFADAAAEGRPLVPCPHPLSWLQGGCAGFCLLDEVGRLVGAEKDAAA